MAYISTFRCAQCGHTWERRTMGSKTGFGNATNPCPECGCGNTQRIDEREE